MLRLMLRIYNHLGGMLGSPWGANPIGSGVRLFEKILQKKKSGWGYSSHDLFFI